MASEVKILEAIFGTSIPTEKAAVLPEIMGHIKAIDDLLQGKPHPQARPRISDPAISGPINSRIVDLYAEHGKDWPKIAAAISQEFKVQISPDACRGRYKDAMSRKEATIRQEGYAAARRETVTPESSLRNPGDKLPTRQEDSNIATKPPEQEGGEADIAALKAEVLARHARGEEVKNIAEALGVRWQWVRAVCAKAPKPEPSSAIIREQPAPVVPLNAMDARIQEMAEQGAMVHEICIAINRNFNHNYSTAEMAEKIRKLQGGANASR